MSELLLEMTPKAREMFKKWNGEGHIEVTRIGSG